MKYMLIGWLLVLTPTGYGEEILEYQEVPRVSIQTNLGIIEIELNPEKAPETVENFLQYAREGFYEGTIFHRVIPDFVIQAGGYTIDYNKKLTYSSVPNEAKNGLKNVRGSVAMARSADPHSASSQFFINLKDNSFLNYTASTLSGWGYAVFGKVVDGMNVVDKIAKLPTEMIDGTLKYAPQTPIVIEAVTVDNVPAAYWSDPEAETDEDGKESVEPEVAAEESESAAEEAVEPEAELKVPVEEAPEDTVSQEEKPEAELKASVEEEAEDTVPEDEAVDSIEAQPAEEEKQVVETATEQQQDSASEQEIVEEPTEASSATTITESSEAEAALSTEPEVNTTEQAAEAEPAAAEQAAAETETPEISKKTLLSIPDSPKFTVTQPPDPPSEPDTPETNPF